MDQATKLRQLVQDKTFSERGSLTLKREREVFAILDSGRERDNFVSNLAVILERNGKVLLQVDAGDSEDISDVICSNDNNNNIIAVRVYRGQKESFLEVLRCCGVLVLITTPEAKNILDTYAFAKSALGYNPNLAVTLVVDGAVSQAEAERVANKFLGVAKKFSQFDVEYLGHIPDEQVIANASSQQELFVAANTIADNMNRIVGRLLEITDNVNK